MKTLFGRSQTQIRSVEQPPEFAIVHDKTGSQ